MRIFTESIVEEAALAWLKGQGWQVLLGADIAPGELAAERTDYGQVVLEQRLRDALARLNSTLPPEALDDAFRKLTRSEGPTLEARNRTLHRLLVDGGLVNPVPVSLCRAMGADVVIAVDLGSDRMGGGARHKPVVAARADATGDDQEPGWAARLRKTFSRPRLANGDLLPSMAGVLSTSIHIMQMRIARSRLAGEPADVLLTPRLGHLALMDYHRGSEAIAEGRAAVIRMLPAIEHALSS